MKETKNLEYFVDAAGDGVIYGKGGRVIIGTPGCSRFFFLGLLEIPNVEQLSTDFDSLRHEILNDAYLQTIESVKPESYKTATFFHATDDAAVVRERVYRLLHNFDGLRFFGVVKDKFAVLDFIRPQQFYNPSYKYNQEDLYDYTIRRIFRDRLHKHDGYNITFARWRKSDRTAALQAALESARQRYF